MTKNWEGLASGIVPYILVQEGESWKVDNMRSAKWDLRKLLKVPKG